MKNEQIIKQIKDLGFILKNKLGFTGFIFPSQYYLKINHGMIEIPCDDIWFSTKKADNSEEMYPSIDGWETIIRSEFIQSIELEEI